MECWVDDLPMVSPFLASEADEALAFELPDQRMSFISFEVFGSRHEDLSDEVRIGDGETSYGSKPENKCGACNNMHHMYIYIYISPITYN